MFKGSLPAMVTPFNNGEVDVKGLRKLVNWHIEQGSHGLVPVGTTGESPTLTHAEHEQVVSEVINEAAGRVPVIAGAGSNNTAEAIRFVEHAKNVGANAALVVTPYYNKPTQAGLIAHFTELANIGLPIVIYNIPGRSVVDMSPETMGELSNLPEIIGVKDATGDLARVYDQRLTCGDDFIQLSGEDATAHGFNAQGGVGCISVTANVAPSQMHFMCEYARTGNIEEASKLNDKLDILHDSLFCESNPIPVKWCLHKMGLIKKGIRLPLTWMDQKFDSSLTEALAKSGVIND